MILHNIERIVVRYPVGKFICEDIFKLNDLFERFITIAKKDLEDMDSYDFVNIICRGSSSIILGSLLLNKLLSLYPNLDVKIITVPKVEEIRAHVSMMRYIYNKLTLNIFTDDCVSTGTTFLETVRMVREYTDNKSFAFDYVLLGNTCSNTSIMEGNAINVIGNFPHSITYNNQNCINHLNKEEQ